MKFLHLFFRYFILLLTLFSTKQSKAQEFKIDYNKLNQITVLKGNHYIYGYNFQGQHGLEFGLAKGRRNLLKPFTYTNAHLTGMFIFGHSRNANQGPLIALNAGVTYAKLFTIFNLQTQFLTNVQQGAFVLRPEVGLTLTGLIDLTYGYNLTAPQNRFPISNHVISLRITRQKVYREIKTRVKSLRLKNIPLKIEMNNQTDSTSIESILN
jgi:hypothetical protein